MKLKCLLCLFIVCCFVNTAAASSFPLGIDDDVLNFFNADEVVMDAQFSVDASSEFGDHLIELINATLSEINIKAHIKPLNDGYSTDLRILMADELLVQIDEHIDNSGSSLTTTLLPNRTLTSSDSALATLFNQPVDMSTLMPDADPEDVILNPTFDPVLAFKDLNSVYRNLTDAIVPMAEEKSSNYNISNVGKAKWSRIARLTPEQSILLAPQIASLLSCGMDDTFVNFIHDMSYNKGFVVALYQTEEQGDDIAVYMKGGIKDLNDKEYNLSFQWAFATDSDGENINTYKMELTAKRSPSNNRVINATYRTTSKDDQVIFKGKSEAIMKQGTQLTKLTINSTLEGDNTDSGCTLNGEHIYTHAITIGDTTRTTISTLVPDLLLSNSSPAVLSGSIKYDSKRSRIPQLGLTIAFSEQAPTFGQLSKTPPPLSEALQESSLNHDWGDLFTPSYQVGSAPLGMTSYSSPSNPTAQLLDTMSDESKQTLLDEMAFNLASNAISVLPKLSPEALAIFSFGVNELDFQAFLDNLY